MAKRISLVISQGQSENPAKRKLEEQLVGAFLLESGIEVTVIPHLYDLAPEGTGTLCLQGIRGDVIIASWIFPRAAHWVLDRAGIRGQMGVTLLDSGDEEEPGEEDGLEREEESVDEQPRVVDENPRPMRKIFHLDLRGHGSAEPYIEEIRRIAKETTTETVDLMGWINGSPKPEQLDRYLNGGTNGSSLAQSNGNGESANPNGEGSVHRIEEQPARRWYPVIDFSRCTNCMECIDFCLFGVYGLDAGDTILVEQPDNCRKGCPACSRVCPENAIIFPQHKTPTIAGSSDIAVGGLKIDLSQLFGAPTAMETAAAERDTELVADGRDAVGLSVGIPKRQVDKQPQPRDDLDDLIDSLDELDV